MIEVYADVCPTTSRDAARGSKMTPDSVRLSSAGRRLGKTCRLAVPNRGVPFPRDRAVAKHPLPIPPSRRRFALLALCQAVAGSAASADEIRCRPVTSGPI